MTANHRPLEECDIELIDRVRASPCLYNTKDPNFRLVHKKEEEWQAIADSLVMSPWEARKRWTVLRDRYARELKQLILHPESTEYGKNDFFLRMDFIRNFVKKREVRRKRYNSRGIEIKEDDKPRPVKMYKVGSEASNSETDETHNTMQKQKTYIIDDSQDSSTGKFSYVEQLSQGPNGHAEEGEQNVSVNPMEDQGGEQEYHDYVEDTSAAYETVEEDTAHISQEVSNNYLIQSSVNSSSNENIVIKPESRKVTDDFNITIEEERLSNQLPHLQQRPNIQNVSLETSSTSLSADTEEYFAKTIASYLRQLSPRYKIKAKVEMMQIIEKFIDLQESKS
ncbi:hinge1 [Cochliomyia hominivorax]